MSVRLIVVPETALPVASAVPNAICATCAFAREDDIGLTCGDVRNPAFGVPVDAEFGCVRWQASE